MPCKHYEPFSYLTKIQQFHQAPCSQRHFEPRTCILSRLIIQKKFPVSYYWNTFYFLNIIGSNYQLPKIKVL